MDSDEEIIVDNLSDISSENEYIENDSEDDNSSSDESIIGNERRTFPRPVISASESESGLCDNDEDENTID
ncbi:unnamed protein product [Didymodactylos carnosus]|uniref:Uncharacterized protein n=2 Tax=Didymodactylos carnosus TaxID=1234261 RepID=A0A8S2ZBU3_9BILA|nr:unnamed protein product [Didymodactylos carnosus]